jgi:hypothetical protein
MMIEYGTVSVMVFKTRLDVARLFSFPTRLCYLASISSE